MGPRTTVPSCFKREDSGNFTFYILLSGGREVLWDPHTLRVIAETVAGLGSHQQSCRSLWFPVPPAGKGHLSNPASPFHLPCMEPSPGCGRGLLLRLPGNWYNHMTQVCPTGYLRSCQKGPLRQVRLFCPTPMVACREVYSSVSGPCPLAHSLPQAFVPASHLFLSLATGGPGLDEANP